MPYLRFLGGASIETEDTHISGPVGQRHRLALLALLAVAAPQGISRDKLLAYLWPERGEDRARNLLNQSVHHIRRAIHRDALISEGTELRLEPEILPSDVWDFQKAVDEGRWGPAQKIYGGRFLDGFHLPDAGAFDRWLDVQQLRFDERYRECLEELANQAECHGDWLTAVRWWKLRMVEEPLNSRVASGLVKALAGAGNLPGAMKIARQHDALVREELGIAPPEAFRLLTHRILEGQAGTEEGAGSHRLPATGPVGEPERSAPPPRTTEAGMDWSPSIRGDGGVESEEPSVLPADDQDVPRGPAAASSLGAVHFRRYTQTAILGISVAVMILVYLIIGGPPPGEDLQRGLGGDGSRGDGTLSIVVLPFENLGAPEDAYRALGVTYELTHRLAATSDLTVIERSNAMEYDESDLRDGRVGAELGVDYALVGAVRWARSGSEPARVQVSPGLVRTSDGVRVWDAHYERAPEDIFRIQEEIVDQVLRHLLGSSMPPSGGVLGQGRIPDVAAYEHFFPRNAHPGQDSTLRRIPFWLRGPQGPTTLLWTRALAHDSRPKR